MTGVTVTSGNDRTADASPTSRLLAVSAWLRTRSRRLFAAGLGLAAVAALLVGGQVAWHQWTHPDLLPDDNGTLRMGPRPLDQATVSFPLTWSDVGPSHLLTFRGARATLATNTASARITFQICERRPGHIMVLGIYSLRAQCASITPLTPGATMTYPSHHPWAHQYLVATIQPTRPGRVRLTKVTFEYSLPSHVLSRTVTDTVRTDVTVPVLPNAPLG
jgi:hypothetical protein